MNKDGIRIVSSKEIIILFTQESTGKVCDAGALTYTFCHNWR